MNKYLLIVLVIVSVLDVVGQEIKFPQEHTLPSHPRILLLKGEEQAIKQAISRSSEWNKMHTTILQASDAVIDMPTLERIKIGRRLLDKSRECLRRILLLSYSYRMTGEEKYFKRAEEEMLKVSGFTDWNPSHFLDVAEMTMALSIGYDWLFDKLSDQSKMIIREAIVKKGIEPSYIKEYNWFLTATHNWNQVCNAGMTYGALAVFEDHTNLSKQTIERALNTIKLSMNDYKPDGAYPEGYGYWGYGTSFNVLFLSAIEKIFNTDFGLSKTEGFLKAAGFHEHMTGVTGLNYNWGDCGLGGGINPAMFWFAQKNNDLSLLWVEKRYLQKEDYSRYANDRLLPAIMIWGKDFLVKDINPPARTTWTGQGLNPVSLMRTSWTDPNGIYLGFKAGSASVNHAHMDIGSFIMEAEGIRWASDFGMQEYNAIESQGIPLFGRTQDAPRWKIFRLNNFVHNTITIDSQYQLVKGYAKIDKQNDNKKFMYAVSDMSSVYENQVATIKRGVAIVNERYVVVQDELTTLNKPTTIRWTMLTMADVKILNSNTVELLKEGKKLILKVKSPAKVNLKTWSTEPPTSYEAPNPGTTLVGFEVEIPANKSETLNVLLVPEKAERKANFKIKPIDTW